MPVTMTARFKIKPESKARVDSAIQEFVRQIEANEPRTHLYLSLQDQDDPNSYLHYFVFEDEEAEVFHRGTGWVKAFTDVLYPELVEDVKFTHYQVVATTRPI